MTEPVPVEQRLRIAVLGDFDGVHTRSWILWFVDRGHDVHAISYYPPLAPLDRVTLHTLKSIGTNARSAGSPASAMGGRLPRGVARLVHAARYRRAGLKDVLAEIQPDIFHAHFVAEHGFYGSFAGIHPYVVTAWGSDILVEPDRDPLSRWIVKRALRSADLITSNNVRMAERIVELGVPRSKVEIITLGADAFFAERWDDSVNVRGRPPGEPPVVLSTRAHEPLYNVAEIIEAFAALPAVGPAPRLVIAHTGSLTDRLRERARSSHTDVEFTGTVASDRLRDLMTGAEVFVSVPSSDGTSVALLQAMAAGCFPVVADLDTQREWIRDGENGLLVPVHDRPALTAAIARALDGRDLRRRAADLNRELVAERGLNEAQMTKMELLYVRLARRH